MGVYIQEPVRTTKIPPGTVLFDPPVADATSKDLKRHPKHPELILRVSYYQSTLSGQTRPAKLNSIAFTASCGDTATTLRRSQRSPQLVRTSRSRLFTHKALALMYGLRHRLQVDDAKRTLLLDNALGILCNRSCRSDSGEWDPEAQICVCQLTLPE
jgi:hypothetical protein